MKVNRISGIVSERELSDASGLSIKELKRYRSEGLLIQGIHWYKGMHGRVEWCVELFDSWIMGPRWKGANKIILSALKLAKPDGALHQLYRFYDSSGVLIYVGISVSVVQRMAEHKRKSSWYGSVANINIENYPNRLSVIEAEKLIIQIEKPLHNVVRTAARIGRLRV